MKPSLGRNSSVNNMGGSRFDGGWSKQTKVVDSYSMYDIHCMTAELAGYGPLAPGLYRWAMCWCMTRGSCTGTPRTPYDDTHHHHHLRKALHSKDRTPHDHHLRTLLRMSCSREPSHSGNPPTPVASTSCLNQRSRPRLCVCVFLATNQRLIFKALSCMTLCWACRGSGWLTTS